MGFESTATYCAIRVAPRTSWATDENPLTKKGAARWQRVNWGFSPKRGGTDVCCWFFPSFYAQVSCSSHRDLERVRVSVSTTQKKNNTRPICKFQYSSSHIQREGAQECSFYQASLPRRLRCKWRTDAVLFAFFNSGLRQPLPNRKPIDSSFMLKTGRVVCDFQFSWMRKWPWPLR